jgi:transcriptional regulator with XRE-family HTH domain
MKKVTRNKTIRELRKLLGQTQAEFAALIGASKDTVVSWENGRNPLSPPLARRIALITGVDGPALMKGTGPLLEQNRSPKQPFTREAFHKHRQTFWGDTPEKSVRRRIGPCADTLELMFLAAAKTGQGEGCNRLPGLLDSFIQWCQQAREDFGLGESIDAELSRRTRVMELTHTYAEWRQMEQTNPGRARMMQFKDDPKKDGREVRTQRVETVPVWMPGESMRARESKGQVDTLRPDF